jgi:hypothetical protein
MLRGEDCLEDTDLLIQKSGSSSSTCQTVHQKLIKTVRQQFYWGTKFKHFKLLSLMYQPDNGSAGCKWHPVNTKTLHCLKGNASLSCHMGRRLLVVFVITKITKFHMGKKLCI